MSKKLIIRAIVIILNVVFLNLCVKAEDLNTARSALIEKLDHAYSDLKNTKIDTCIMAQPQISSKKDYIYILKDIMPCSLDADSLDNKNFLQYLILKIILTGLKTSPQKDLIKTDIVRIKEQDQYGKPRWDTIDRIAHMEVSWKGLSEVLANDKRLTASDLQKSIVKLNH